MVKMTDIQQNDKQHVIVRTIPMCGPMHCLQFIYIKPGE